MDKTHRSRVAGIGLLLTAVVIGGFSPSLADRLDEEPVTLAWAREGPTALYTGQYHLIYGGHDASFSAGAMDRFNHVTGEIDSVEGTADDLVGASSAWNGTHMFVFGGHRGPATEVGFASDSILIYTSSGGIQVANATLPTARTDTTAVWDGTFVWLFGGHDGSDETYGDSLDEILRYEPGSDVLTVMSARLPEGRWGMSGAFDGTAIYLFGGANETGQLNHFHKNGILRYDRLTESIHVMNATFPSGRHFMAAVSDGSDPNNWYNNQSVFAGRYIYLFGGHAGDSGQHVFVDEIWQYEPGADRLRKMGATLPRPLAYAQATWADGEAFIFGGYSTNGGFQDSIFRYNLTPLPPGDFHGAPGPDVGGTTLSWSPPYDDEADSYQLWRRLFFDPSSPSAAPGNFEFLTSLPGSQATFVDSGLADGAQYEYKLSAITSDYLLESPGNFTKVLAPDRPSAPRNLIGSSASFTINLVWQPPLSDGGISVSSYNIYRGITQLSLHDTVSGTSLSYGEPCNLGQTFRYRVSASNAVGESPWSNEVQVACSL